MRKASSGSHHDRRRRRAAAAFWAADYRPGLPAPPTGRLRKLLATLARPPAVLMGRGEQFQMVRRRG